MSRGRQPRFATRARTRGIAFVLVLWVIAMPRVRARGAKPRSRARLMARLRSDAGAGRPCRD